MRVAILTVFTLLLIMCSCQYNLSKEDVLGVYVCKDCKTYKSDPELYPNFQDTLIIKESGTLESLYYGKQKYTLRKSEDNWLYISFTYKEHMGHVVPFYKVGSKVYIDFFDGILQYEKVK